MSRESLSKKMRFEVFKRDSFTCQYCGNKAPQVVLEVDHIEPVSKGGTNEILNLVTSLQYEDASKAFNMIPRIAYYKSNPDKQVNPELFYIRGILRNRLSYLDDKKALHLLIKANRFIDDSELKETALMCKNWTEFRETLEDYIAEYERVDSDG